MDIARAGDRGLLVTLGPVKATELHAAAARARAVDGVAACVAGHSSLLLIFEGEPDADAMAVAVRSNSRIEQHEPRRLTIPVSFEGPDLPEFLERTGLSRDDFLNRVQNLTLSARYLGFRGGFAYLDGWPEEWSMPRRPTSRPRVPAGTFAIAGSVAGFYPFDSPGGWNLLGHTSMDLEYALRAGDEIRIQWSAAGPAAPRDEKRRRGGGAPPGLELLRAPLATTIGAYDLSRLERGMPPGGPFDPVAAAAANEAVGNPPDAPLLECAMAGPRGRVHDGFVAAWCGPDLTVSFYEGDFAIGRIEGGLRGYLAIGRTRGAPPTRRRLSTSKIIQVIPGPHESPVREIECEVTPQLDRVGIRLQPLRDLQFTAPADLPSIGVQFGTLQLHPDGSIIAMGPDHPVTGGYLQPMTVISSERWKLGQLKPGDRVSFATQLP